MNVNDFFKQSGLKILSVAGLTDCEYSIMLYLLNCSLSGIDQLVTTEAELAAILRQNVKFIKEALTHLYENNFIKLHYGDLTQKPKSQSMRIAIQFDIDNWKIDLDKDESSQAAVVYPFKRGGQFTLVNGEKGKKPKKKSKVPEETWRRIYSVYMLGRELTDDEQRKCEQSAKTLAETHPVDQVLLLIRHFNARIPSLSLLASSWHHYMEMYEDEEQHVDLSEARAKHQELDQKIRDAALETLANRKDLGLSDDEIAVLEVFSSHRHPRRQLFWAFQLKSRYPKLHDFFIATQQLMLPVTTDGTVVKF